VESKAAGKQYMLVMFQANTSSNFGINKLAG
jgi:hypothetical protein